MTVVVAVVLALVSQGLSAAQQRNELVAKKSDILNSAGVDLDEVENIDSYFEKHIKGIVVNHQGETVDTVEALNINAREMFNLKDETKRLYPLYVFTSEEGERNYIIPLEGSGLWDIIWGYLALEEDLETVAGASFDHAAETPGLGAEIGTSSFETQFNEKKIFDKTGEFVGVTVRKGSLDKVEHQVQGVSGATITSDGVTEMIQKDVAFYLPYFEKLKNQQ